MKLLKKKKYVKLAEVVRKGKGKRKREEISGDSLRLQVNNFVQLDYYAVQ